MKNILLTTCKAFGWLAICLSCALLGYVLSMADASELFARGYKAGYSYVKSVKELQVQVGAKVDGKVSPDWKNSETQKKVDAAYGQQCANVQINRKSMGIVE